MGGNLIGRAFTPPDPPTPAPGLRLSEASANSSFIQAIRFMRSRQERPMKPIFVQLRCTPGKTYEVADAIYQMELVSEL